MKMGTGKAKDGKNGVDSSKYVRYTTEQVEVLEKIYNECPKPSSSRRQQIIKELPILSNIGQKQLKVWFQNRRCREKQRKETGRLQNWNTKLNALNQILVEENERLQKLAAQLSTENQYLRQQLQIPHVNTDTNHRPTPPPQVLMATTDTSSESVVTSGQHHKLSPLHLSQDTSILQLITIAEKTLMDFLAKATGNMVEWIQMPGMKPGPDSIGAVAVSRFWGGVAARACSLVDLEPFKVAEIVKHRPHWLEECRRTDVLATFTAENGGMLELVHTEMYAPTTLAPARDLCTLRYTICTEDGSLVICERSLNNTCGVQISPPIPGFSRTSMLPSGYLIRPHDNGGSLVMAVDNLNFELESISGSLNPFYESELVLVQKMTHRVLCYLQSIARELKGGVSVGNHRASSLRGFSRRLIRGFNNAVNGLSEDGWILLSSVRTGPVCVYLNPYPNCRQPGQPDSLNDVNSVVGGGIICAKASVLLQGVSPVSFLRFMQEHYTAWTHLGMELCQGAMPKYSSVQVLNPAVGADEALEVVRLEMIKPSKADNAANGHETFMLQLCSGLGEASAGGCTQMIYAPISASIPDDTPLLPSGFRIFRLDNSKDISCFSQTLDLTSTLEDGVLSGRQSDNHPGLSSCQQQYVLTMAFQFMYEANLHDTVALKAQQHVQGILDFVHTATPMFSSGLVHNKGHFPDVDGFNLVCRIADSYRLHVGVELLTTNGSAEAVVKNFYSLKEAIICCVWKPFPEFLLANCAAMEMLETSPLGLREMSLQRMLTDNINTDYSKPPPFMHNKGYTHLPAGICVTSKGRGVSFQHAIGWKVLVDDGKMQVAAFMFNNWSFTRAC